MSRIEWCDRSDWNCIRGCTRVSDGCTSCYAEAIAGRFSGPGQPFHGFAKRTPAGARWTGKVELIEPRLTLPLKWRKPARIFVNSAYDLFHDNVPDAWIDRVFAVMALCPQHTFQILTKRSKRMREYMTNGGPTLQQLAEVPQVGRDVMTANTDWPLPNVWVGVSAEDQPRADQRIPDLLATPAAVRFVSAEPLLGPIDLMAVIPNPIIYGPVYGMDRLINWVIVGGESGPGARPMHPDWARALRDQCVAAGVAFHFKQWGEWHPDALLYEEAATGAIPAPSMKIGKKRAGRLLDGREWNEFPDTKEAA